jgi:hypothetical protein
VDVIEEAEHPTGTNTIGGMSTAERERVEPVAPTAGGLALTGPTLQLRYPTADDAPALFELASDPAVTRYFS